MKLTGRKLIVQLTSLPLKRPDRQVRSAKRCCMPPIRQIGGVFGVFTRLCLQLIRRNG